MDTTARWTGRFARLGRGLAWAFPVLAGVAYLAISLVAAEVLTRPANRAPGLDPRRVGADAVAWETQTDDRLTELRTSARGWHGVQLAVLGFIGLCGVLSGGSAAPQWLEWLSMWLALAALACACVATFLVGAAAWPLYRARVPVSGEEAPTGR